MAENGCHCACRGNCFTERIVGIGRDNISRRIRIAKNVAHGIGVRDINRTVMFYVQKAANTACTLQRARLVFAPIIIRFVGDSPGDLPLFDEIPAIVKECRFGCRRCLAYTPPFVVVLISVLLGAAFLWGIDKLTPHLHVQRNEEEGIRNVHLSKTTKMFMAVTIHNFPEGLSVGIAYGVALAAVAIGDGSASSMLMGALILAIGIGIQNIPEGAVVALPFLSETGSKGKAFMYGTLSGAIEPIAAVLGLFLAFLFQPLMPWALAFAAGCMLYVIAEEMVPDLQSEAGSHEGVWSLMVGFVLMMVLDTALGQ